MGVLNNLSNLGVPRGMSPEDAKYIQMSNTSALLMIAVTVPYMVLCFVSGWTVVAFEVLGVSLLLSLTFLFNSSQKHLFALIFFGTVLNLHLMFVTIAMGRESWLQLLIFFTAGGAINLFRRERTKLMVITLVSVLAYYHAALILEGILGPLYQLSWKQTQILRSFSVYSIFVLILLNGLTGRLGAISVEDRLLKEKEKSEELLQRLKEEGKKRTQFFHDIAHELRTPLSLIMGPLNDLLNGKGRINRKEMQSQLAMMVRNTRRLLRLINHLLDLNRIDVGIATLNPEKGHLARYVRELVQSFEPVAEQRKIELHLEDKTEDCLMYYDQETVEKIVSNLLSNAIKFTPRDGHVKVTLKESSKTDGVIIAVHDNGTGIPEKHLESIFDRFYQVNSPAARGSGGTGIGLSLVKELVELYGGTIEVESGPSRGTTFTVSLPQLKALSPPGPYPSDGTTDGHTLSGLSAVELETAGISFSPETEEEPVELHEHPDALPLVLVVEDNRDMREYIHQSLVPYCRIIEAADGQEGLEKAKEFMPRLIISDIMMNNMDGFELCRALQKGNNLRLVPVILLTARVSHDSIIKGLESGAVDYITKPFSRKMLQAKVSAILQREAAQEELSLRDGLTGLFTRMAWVKWSERELKRIARSGASASLAFIDLDDFKTVNDTYGHQAGDQVLSELAKTLLFQLRGTDLVGRYGGEEFVLFLPDSAGDTAVVSLERILKLFTKLRIGRHKLQCSFSAGVAEISSHEMKSLEEYIRRADEAMYEVKLQGKNRVSLWKQPD